MQQCLITVEQQETSASVPNQVHVTNISYVHNFADYRWFMNKAKICLMQNKYAYDSHNHFELATLHMYPSTLLQVVVLPVALRTCFSLTTSETV